MKTYLITGCAGFIGSNFVHYMLKKYPEILLVNLDKLTYAGNLENLKDVEGDPRHVFVQGDICDKELVESLFAKYDFDYVINFAAESHVDRSIKNPEIFVQSNVMGTVNLLQRAKEAWYDADAKTWKEGKKYLQVSTDEVYGALGADGFFMETTPLCPHSPYSSSKASADMFVMAFHDTYGMPVNITRCSNNYGPYQFPEKLIPLMINNVKHHKQLPVYGDGMQIPAWLMNGLSASGGMLVVVGLALTTQAIFSKYTVPFVLVGFVLTKYLAMPVLSVAILGFVCAYMVFDRSRALKQVENTVGGDDFYA